MSYTAATTAYRVWQDLGKIDALEEFIATGGSTTTVVNGKVADRQDRPEDNYSIDYTAIIVRDTAGAAPQGEMRRISSYTSGTYTHTVDTAFSAAVASGDLVAIANADIPMYEMYRALNNALVKMGDIPQVDTSITSNAAQTEYTLPVALKRENLLRIEYNGWTGDANDNDWVHIPRWDILPSAPGTTTTIIIPQIPSGRTIRIVYRAVHPTLSASTDVVSEYIHPAVLIPAVTKEVLRWYNGSTGGGENYWLQRENEAAFELEKALKEHPIWEPKRSPKYTNFQDILTPSKLRREREDTYYAS